MDERIIKVTFDGIDYEAEKVLLGWFVKQLSGDDVLKTYFIQDIDHRLEYFIKNKAVRKKA